MKTQDEIQEAFEEFHFSHPEVYEMLVALCKRWIKTKFERWSIDGAFHVLRWERRIEGLPDPAEQYKLNDHYTSRYARLIMAENDDLENIFATRTLAVER